MKKTPEKPKSRNPVGAASVDASLAAIAPIAKVESVVIRIEADVYECSRRDVGEAFAMMEACDAVVKAWGQGDPFLAFQTSVAILKRVFAPEIPPERIDAIKELSEIGRLLAQEAPKLFGVNPGWKL